MKQKSWTDNEKALKNFLSEKFGLRGICIEKKIEITIQREQL